MMRSVRGVDDRLDHVAELVQRGPGRYRVAGQQVIEVGARPDQTVGGKVGKIGPLQLEGSLAAVDPQALVVQPTGRFGGVDAEPDQLPGAARGETVPADLLPGKPALLQQRDVQPAASQVGRRRRAGRAGADDDHIGVDSRRGRTSASSVSAYGPSPFRDRHGVS